MKKYEPLGNYLAALPATQESETLTFTRIMEIIGDKLPDSAYDHREWWANQDYGSRAYHWQEAGFKVDKVDQQRGIVTFRRDGAAAKPGKAEDKALEQALRDINARAGKEEGLGSGRFTTLLNNRGGLGAAKYALRPQAGGAGAGFDSIMAAGRPDLTLEHVVLQKRFRDRFTPEERAEAQRRLGYLDEPDIRGVVAAIEDQATHYRFGELQEIRRSLKGLGRVSRTIFREETIFDRYAYHYGGRTELQFNVGFEEAGDGETYLRHGLAISLKRGPAVTAVTDEMLTRIARLNQFIEDQGDEYTGFLMYNSWYDREDWSGDHALRPVPAEIVKLGAFIFIGRRQDPAHVSVGLILRDYDRLLPIYEFVESANVPQIVLRQPLPDFVPGLTRKPSSAKMSVTERKLNKDLRHNDIQYALGQHLIGKHGKDAVRDEFPTGNGTKIDLALKLGNEFTYYEIKVGETAQHCIRQAIGQLLEYSYWPEGRRAARLVIVGEPELKAYERKYLKDLRKEFRLPLYYEQFDMQKRRLVTR